ncbi:hypothetical protein [Actinoallomurus liliacearum]|uniref:hypothetical protein n=1 Tax=Actinoallomurus liliacearum TaxID=1080073 RepID=UPI0031EDDD79
MDPAFANAVVKECIGEVADTDRFVAPSYGYDVLPVLGHALIARNRRRYRRTAILISPFVPVLLSFLGMTATIIGIALWLWATWAAVFLERLITLHTLVAHLVVPAPEGGRHGFDGRIPDHAALTQIECDRINREQDGSSGLVYYSGYRPFVGAGTWQTSSAFPILLNRANDGILPPMDDRRSPGRAEVAPFTTAEIMGYIQRRLTAVLQAEEWEGQRIEELEIARRWYRTAIGRVRPVSPKDAPLPTEQGVEHYDAAREYLCVRVGSWDQEVVASVFVNLDVRGRTLYTETHRYELRPIKAAYHEVDRLPTAISPSDVRLVAAKAVVQMAGEAIGAAVTICTFPYHLLLRALSRNRPVSPRDQNEFGAEFPARRADVLDYGARRSVREIGQAPGAHHFFQDMDVKKYGDIVQKRVSELVIDFLEERNLDTGEYRARQATILNQGIIQTGSGRIVNTGRLAVGENASA